MFPYIFSNTVKLFSPQEWWSYGNENSTVSYLWIKVSQPGSGQIEAMLAYGRKCPSWGFKGGAMLHVNVWRWWSVPNTELKTTMGPHQRGQLIKFILDTWQALFVCCKHGNHRFCIIVFTWFEGSRRWDKMMLDKWTCGYMGHHVTNYSVCFLHHLFL